MYIDLYLIISIFIDYYIIKTCSLILHVNTSNKRIILGSIVSQVSIILLIFNLNYFINIIFKIIICLIIILISFGYNDIKTYIKNIIYYYIINFFLGGILFYFKNEGLLKYKYYLLLIPIFLSIYKYFYNNTLKYLSLKRRVSIYLNNGKVLFLNGYIDTGNTLIEPFSNRKVIIINKKVDENFYLVPYKTIDNCSLIKCFNPKELYFEGLGRRNDISVGIINKRFNGYNCLLNYKLMEESC